MKHTKNPVCLHYFSKFMGILLFVLKYMFISLLLKMINGFFDQQISWPVPLMRQFTKELNWPTVCFLISCTDKQFRDQICEGNFLPDPQNMFKIHWLISKYFVRHTREGQKVPATIFFLFTWVHLYKGGSVYIKYEPLSFMPCNMDSVACLVALRH